MMKSRLSTRLLVHAGCLLSILAAAPSFSQEDIKKHPSRWSRSFNIDRCTFSTTGSNQYFRLEPSYQLAYEGINGNDTTRLTITVLQDTVQIGKVTTRVIEERESVNGRLSEVSRNFFALCAETGTLFYFGEDVDNYRDGTVAGHDGSWRAEAADATAGVMMPGMVLMGSRYYEEVAPYVAMDRAEIISTDETIESPAGRFTKCVKILETTPLEPGVKEYKWYAPGVGLVKDGSLILTHIGSL